MPKSRYLSFCLILCFASILTSTFSKKAWGQSFTSNDSLVILKESPFDKKLNADQKQKVARKIEKFNKRAYLDFKIDSISGVDNKLYFNKGPKYYWGDLSFSNDSTTIKIPSGKITPANYKRFNMAIKASYEDNGFAFVDIKQKAIFINNQVNLDYTINKGELFVFDTLKIINNKNAEKYLANITQIKSGNLFSQKKVNKTNNNINGTGVYTLQSQKLLINKNKVKLELEVDEIKTNTFSGFLGLQPNSENNTNLTGQVALNLTNAFKIGENIQFDWKKDQPQSQLLSGAFSIPFLVNSPVGILASIHLDQQDSTFTNTKLQGGLSFYLANITFATAEIKYVSSTFNESVNQAQSKNESILIGIAYKTRHLNRIINPTRGYNFSLQGFGGNRSNEMGISVIRFDYALNLETYIPLRNNTMLLRNYSAGIISDSLKTNEFNRIGGINTLRGFDENSIFAKQFSITTVEYRYILDNSSNIIAFIDYGISQELNQNKLELSNRLGIGLGLNMNTKAGLLSIAYAVGKTNNNPIKMNQGKIHIGYLTRF